jgi:hypothetical protein
MIYNIVSPRPESFGEVFCQLRVGSGEFYCTGNNIPQEFRAEFDELIEESESWSKTVHGGYSPDSDGNNKMPACGGMKNECLTPEERLERLIQRLPNEFPVAIRQVEQQEKDS